ncbi:Xaa-Pro dipeptidyl-peptidase [Virgibacillus sp. L01]|uniref:Xaa-Pro dipeptidyl-peptidase n=1 Tax=Virgibacillus sp. L01 TaxID=3457429 RepID=UPI003FD23588
MKKTLFFTVCLLFVFSIDVAAKPANPDAEPKIKVEDGVTQAVFSMEEAVRETVYIETAVDSDGDGQNDKVHAEIIRPKETEEGLEVPVIFEMSPYRAGLSSLDFHDVDVELNPVEKNDKGKPYAADLPGYYDDYFVPRGYAVVLAESIGSGLSDGCPTVGDEREIRATEAVIDWLNGRADAFTEDGQEVSANWSTGNVGMTGVSYNGTLPNGVATTGVKGLKTIVPIGAISSWYDYYRSNGAVVAPGGYQGEDADVLGKAVLTRDNPEVCSDLMKQIEDDQDRETGDYNEFWDARNYLNDVKNIEASVFVVHGLNDWNVKTQQFSQWWEELKHYNVPRKLWLHQGGHSSPYYFRNEEWLNTLNKWFDHWLYDIDNGIMDEPVVDIQREDDSWETTQAWPNADATETKLHFTAGSSETGGLSVQPVPNENKEADSLLDNALIEASELVQNPLLKSPNRQAYLSKELTDSYRMSGTPNVSIRASIDQPTANLTGLLVDYGPDGAEIVTRGWMDPQNINSMSKSKALVPNRQYTFDWDMQPDDYQFKTGHQIGIVIISSDNKYTIRPEAGTTISIDPERSHVTLPLVGDIKDLR